MASPRFCILAPRFRPEKAQEKTSARPVSERRLPPLYPECKVTFIITICGQSKRSASQDKEINDCAIICYLWRPGGDLNNWKLSVLLSLHMLLPSKYVTNLLSMLQILHDTRRGGFYIHTNATQSVVPKPWLVCELFHGHHQKIM